VRWNDGNELVVISQEKALKIKLKCMNRISQLLSVLLMLLMATATLICPHPQTARAQSIDHASLRALFKPLPTDPSKSIAPPKIELGKKLFNEKKLSLDETLSCNSCHDLKTFGVDNKRTSSGLNGQLGVRNSPTVYNAALHVAQFWDGRARDVEEQALGPVMNPVEMAMPAEVEVMKRLAADPDYAKLFASAFPGEGEPLTFKNMGSAIGAFERTLITPSRVDEYLGGNNDALSAGELKGFVTFRDLGCAACHSGATFGGQMFQKIGVVKPYMTKDEGRFAITKQETEKYVFKVPSLRNVEKTAPYFHDGSVQTLPEAVNLMAEYQLGKTLTEEQTNDLVTFLNSLTGAPQE
jgi:cytochrome c peroxidase